MQEQRRAFLAICGTAVLGACAAPVVIDDGGPGRGHGPPPHAPAHGYRAQTAEGVALAFDEDLGVYLVIGSPGLYWHRGRYLRRHYGEWQSAPGARGPWRGMPPGQVPPGLRQRGG